MTDPPLTRPALLGWHRLLAVFAGAVLTVVAGAGPASAHDVLKSTSPADRQTVQTVPRAVVLTFDEPAIAMGTQLVVIGPSGEVQEGQPRLVDNTVTQDLQPGAPAGPYRVAWRVTSADGHPVSGTFTFTAATAAAGQPPIAETSSSTKPTSARPSQLSVWLTIGVIAIAFCVTAVLHASRRRTPRPSLPKRNQPG